MWQDAMWVGVPAEEIRNKKIYHGDMTGRFAYFRHTFILDCPGILSVDITANSRYRLWVNGQPVLSGPCKGDMHRVYYETVNLSEYLSVGENCIAVQVLYQDPQTAVYQSDQRAAIFSVCSPLGGHRLALEGTVTDEGGKKRHTLTTGVVTWHVWLEGSYYLKSEAVTEYLGAVCEDIDCSLLPQGWKMPGFDDGGWLDVVALEPVQVNDFMRNVGLLQRFPVCERPIPLMYEKTITLTQEADSDKNLSEHGTVTIPAGTTKRIILDAGVEVNGYPCFRFQGGRGSRVEITYFEKFTGKGAKTKTDAQCGEITGITDKLLLSGEKMVFEPFWYRTFRFISVSVEACGDATMEMPSYRKTGYPLEVKSWVSSSEGWVEQVWSLCVRTLKNCMMETYMDCPYYEQNQFPMDTRLQALFCAAISNDDRLTMKALEDFHCSMTPEGLVHGRYPSVYPQIISTFSLHYIYMLEECYRRKGDIKPFRHFLPDVDRILAYYQEKIGEDGMVGRLGYWEFIDWQQAWAHLGGTPEALQHGSSTIINLMYALALEKAAVLMDAAGRSGLGAEYRCRRQDVLNKVRLLCWDDTRHMFREGPVFEQYSQHAQSWAVLNGMLEDEQAVQALLHAMEDEDVLPCSFSTSFEWFRALEMAGLYEKTQQNMKRWATLPAMGNTTCPETPGESRSECHAWSALPIYEFVRTMAGIQERMSTVEICPHPCYLQDLKGAVMTGGGPITFCYTKKEESWRYEFTLPRGVDAIFIHADGKREELSGGQTYVRNF